jgi:hypothetical protein
MFKEWGKRLKTKKELELGIGLHHEKDRIGGKTQIYFKDIY